MACRQQHHMSLGSENLVMKHNGQRVNFRCHMIIYSSTLLQFDDFAKKKPLIDVKSFSMDYFE